MSPVYLTKEQVQEIGALLKSSRERQGENLAEVAFRIALSPSQLRAIEAGDLRPFYSGDYFLQAAERYANFLNIKLPQHATKSSAQESSARIHAAQEQTLTADSHTAQSVERSAETLKSNQGLTTANQGAQIFTVKVGTRSWGWLAFGAAALITVGVLKISFDKPAAPEATLIASAVTATPAPTDNASPATMPLATAAVAPPPAAPPAPAPATAPAATSQDRLANPSSSTMNALALGPSDSHVESQASTWVQLVKTNGEKTNLKIEPGQKIEFAAGTTAAVVFGQPDKTVLKIKDKTVNLKPFVTTDNPSRALVILNQIRD